METLNIPLSTVRLLIWEFEFKQSGQSASCIQTPGCSRKLDARQEMVRREKSCLK